MQKRSLLRSVLDFIGVLAVSVGIVLCSYSAYRVIDSQCVVFQHYFAERAFGEYQQHIEAVDRSLQNRIPAPSYMVAQLKSDLRELQTGDYPVCQRPARAALECAMSNILVSADRFSQEGGNPVAESAQRNYQMCMEEYFYEISELKQ